MSVKYFLLSWDSLIEFPEEKLNLFGCLVLQRDFGQEDFRSLL